MTDAQVIAALGGNMAVADRLGIPKSTVANWRQRGIPWRHRYDVQKFAKARKIKLPENFLYHMVKA